jgi:hypothetical protein
MRKFRLAGWLTPILVVCALAAAPAFGADMFIANDGAGGAPATIRLRGPITRGDDAALEAALRLVRQADANTINGVPFITVELDSPGGDVVEALDVGRTIYQNFLMTLVRPGHECVSACVFVLMAGAVHTPADGSNIGLHRPLLVSWSHISAREAHARYDGLMEYLHQYFQQLGVSDAAYAMMMSTDSYGMRYFSPTELDRLRLRGEDPAWERFYHAKWAAAIASGTMPSLDAPATEAPRIDLSALPRLAPVNEIYRSVVFMPGDGPYPAAGVELPKLRTEWAPLDNGWQPLWGSVDLLAMARMWGSAMLSWLQSAWWLVAIIGFELLRAQPWPGDSRSPRRRREQWRLDGLVSPGGAAVPGPA